MIILGAACIALTFLRDVVYSGCGRGTKHNKVRKEGDDDRKIRISIQKQRLEGKNEEGQGGLYSVKSLLLLAVNDKNQEYRRSLIIRVL